MYNNKAVQLKWKKFFRILTILVVIYLTKTCLETFFIPRSPCLQYDPNRRQFFISIAGRPHLENNIDLLSDLVRQNKNRTSRVYDQLYPISAEYPYKFVIRSAHLIYSRISLQHWISSIEAVFNAGLNTVEIDIVWNVHEPINDAFDFEQGSNDLVEFIKLVKHFKLFLIVRIDPYVPCSDYDFGGLPAWLLGGSDRTSEKALLSLDNADFIEAYLSYLRSLLSIIEKHQTLNGGPIIGLLIQNYAIHEHELNLKSYPSELAKFYNNDYFDLIADVLDEFGVYEILLTSINMCEWDRARSKGHEAEKFCEPSLSVVLPASIDEIQHDWNRKREDKYEGPVKSSACFDSNLFGSKYWQRNASEPVLNEKSLIKERNAIFNENLKSIHKSGKSFRLANFYCRLNFNNLAMAAHHDLTQLRPISNTNKILNRQCLVDHQGQLTRNYLHTFNLLSKRSNYNDAWIDLINKIGNKNTKEEQQDDVVDLARLDLNKLSRLKITHILTYEKIVFHLNDPIFKHNKGYLNMEYVSAQMKLESLSNLYVLYRFLNANFTRGTLILIHPSFIKDYAVFTCDFTKHLITIDPVSNQYNIRNPIEITLDKFECQDLYILVENLGRLSDLDDLSEFYGQQKGLVDKKVVSFKRRNEATKRLDEIEFVSKWIVNVIDFLPTVLHRLSFNSDYLELEKMNASISRHYLMHPGPICAYAAFNFNRTSRKSENVYLLLNSFKKGAVFLNSYSLGKYWNEIGPFQTLYVPDEFLLDGLNEMIIFDMQGFAMIDSKNPFSIYLVNKNVKS